jgi:hypothetical protein
MVTNSLSTFHQWLLALPAGQSASRTIVLHGEPRVPGDQLVEEIASYLNEYDDDGAGSWFAATSEIVLQIAEDPGLRRLLAMEGPCPNCPPTGPCGIGKTLTALGKKGHVVFLSQTSPGKHLDLPDAFHAGIGAGVGKGVKCHVVLNPELMQPTTIAHVVSDVFLDWCHEESQPHSSKNASSSAKNDQT